MNASSLLSPSSRLPKSHHGPKQRTQNLHLPGLPRFHPANYQPTTSADSSNATTPLAALDMPQPSISPRQQHRHGADAQRLLYGVNRHTASPLFSPPVSSRRQSKPTSPRLHPLGSPGPVTPLELEEAEGYLSIGAGSRTSLPEAAKTELAEALHDVTESSPPARGDGLLHRREPGSKSKPSTRV